MVELFAVGLFHFSRSPTLAKEPDPLLAQSGTPHAGSVRRTHDRDINPDCALHFRPPPACRIFTRFVSQRSAFAIANRRHVLVAPIPWGQSLGRTLRLYQLPYTGSPFWHNEPPSHWASQFPGTQRYEPAHVIVGKTTSLSSVGDRVIRAVPVIDDIVSNASCENSRPQNDVLRRAV
jgi:hypothetical protein